MVAVRRSVSVPCHNIGEFVRNPDEELSENLFCDKGLAHG